MLNPNYRNTPFKFNLNRNRKKHEVNKELHNPQYLLCQLQPIVDFGLDEVNDSGICQGMMEVAIVSYLLGKGYDYETAHDIVELWEKNKVFKYD